MPCLNICKGSSITPIIYNLALQICGNGPTTQSPCNSGNWIDFSASIPLSGSTSGVNWIIGPFGEGNTGNPSYKWTKDGDLKLRGGFVFNATPTINKTYFDIPLVNLSPSCFSTNWKQNQGVVTFVDMFLGSSDQQSTIVMRGVVYISNPSGTLFFNYTFVDTSLAPMRCEIDLGGTTFNLG